MDDLKDALPDDNMDDDLDLESFGKKKKKKKRGDAALADEAAEENKENGKEVKLKLPLLVTVSCLTKFSNY